MDLYGYRTDTITTSASGSTPGIANSISANWGELTMTSDAPEYFTTSGSGTRTSLGYTGSVGSTSNYTATDVLSGIVSGVLGSTTLTGTYSATFTNSKGTSGTFSGPITINPDGTFNFSYTNLSGSNGTYTVTGAGSSSRHPGHLFHPVGLGQHGPDRQRLGQPANFNQPSDPTNGTYPIWGTRTGVLSGAIFRQPEHDQHRAGERLLSSRGPGQFHRHHAGGRQRRGRRETGVMTTVAIGQVVADSNTLPGR